MPGMDGVTATRRIVDAGLADVLVLTSFSDNERIVKAHLTSAFARIGVADRTQAALWVERHGL